MKEFSIVLKPEEGYQEQEQLKAILAEKAGCSAENILILQRSLDARKRDIQVHVKFLIGEFSSRTDCFRGKNVSQAEKVVVIGAGPAGMFAALRLIELGLKPIVLERGKDVRARRRDLANITKNHIVNPDSNYCFGEGGAGTYSDGKLYTRSKKRGDIRRILELFVAHGAKEEILYESHPHIGTNKLPNIVAAIRERILAFGGEFHFESRVSAFRLNSSKTKILGLELANGSLLECSNVILATGHSARDIFKLLKSSGVAIEAKPFALGVRVEHPQALIDEIQYKQRIRNPFLPASSYALVQQVPFKGIEKGVFSFCMCPGGFIVPAATENGEIVVNGMSPSRRDSKFANSGIVVSVDEENWGHHTREGELAGLAFQAEIEKRACNVSGNRQAAPAQRLADFVRGKISKELNPTSYVPGLVSMDMKEVLPEAIAFRLKEGFKAFGNKMRGFLTNEAQIVGVESRTSSPVRIPRDKVTLEHPQVKGLFPCGEGAGYAGGIMSAAMDGERVAEAVALSLGLEIQA